MSKMDALRAMREAKYERTAGRAKSPARSRPAPTAPTAPPVRPAADADPPVEADEADEPTEQLCGHRNMGGRTCTREHGHAAKSHRYS